MLIAKAKLSDKHVFQLISELEAQYPGDVGLFAPLLLNVITSKARASHVSDAETPHAYIKGTGLEIMAKLRQCYVQG